MVVKPIEHQFKSNEWRNMICNIKTSYFDDIVCQWWSCCCRVITWFLTCFADLTIKRYWKSGPCFTVHNKPWYDYDGLVTSLFQNSRKGQGNFISIQFTNNKRWPAHTIRSILVWTCTISAKKQFHLFNL